MIELTAKIAGVVAISWLLLPAALCAPDLYTGLAVTGLWLALCVAIFPTEN